MYRTVTPYATGTPVYAPKPTAAYQPTAVPKNVYSTARYSASTYSSGYKAPAYSSVYRAPASYGSIAYTSASGYKPTTTLGSYGTRTAAYPATTSKAYDPSGDPGNIYPSSFLKTELSLLALFIALLFQL
jgi:hypothetical protein